MPSIHANEHVVALFSEMARTYGAVNLISSFGFCRSWRKACIQPLLPVHGRRCADLMAGMGEATAVLSKYLDATTSVDVIDFCPAMIRRAEAMVQRQGLSNVNVRTADVLALPEVPTYDRIACTFGLKTLDDSQLQGLASLVGRLLHAQGIASFVEIHVPAYRGLQPAYLAYVRHVIPLIGRLLLGNPANYRWLAVYTEDFARRDRFAEQLRSTGLEVTTRPLFFGCARLYVAAKH